MNKFFKLTIFLTAACFISACAVGPDFEKPKSDLPESFENSKDKKTKEVSAEEIANWWKIFEDETLNSLIERALENNFDLQIARANLAAARASLGSAQSGLFPTLDANAGMKESGSGTTATKPSYNAGLSAEWEIDIFGQTRRSIESVEADYLASQADMYAVQISVASEVAQGYYLYRAYQEELKITKENLETQKNTYDVMKRRAEAGTESPLSSVRALAQVNATAAQLPNFETKLLQARYALELLLGLPVGSLKEELKDFKAMPEFEFIVPETLPAELLSRRPDIIAAEYKIKSASAKIGQAKADFYPKFYLSGDISYRAPSVGNMFETQYGSWSVGPTARWNLFSAGKTYYNVKMQEAITEAAGVSWQKVVYEALKETEDYLLATSKEAERVKLLAESVKENVKAYEMSLKAKDEGYLEFIDLLDVQRTMLSAQQSLAESRRQVLSNIVSLYKAFGGGWEIPTQKE